MLMHYNNRRQAYWWILVFALACLGWQSHAIANNQCLATDNGIYGEAELRIDKDVTMNGYDVDKGDTNNNGIDLVGAINNPSMTLTSMGSVSFGTTNIDLDDNDVLSPGSYGEVEVKKDSNITMQAGDYYIDYFDVKKNVTIILDGPVTIHVGKFDLDNDVEMNGPYNNSNPVTTNGDAANLTVKWYGGGTEDNKFHLHDDVKFTGIIYSTGVGGNEGVKFHKRAKFFGGIFTDNIIKIGEDTEFTYGTNEQEAAAAVLGCESLLGQCSAVFPDGASTHSDSGTISFGFNAQLIDSDNNQLATIGVSKNGGSNVNTCDTADCVATGTPSDTAPTINFQTKASTVDVTVGFQGSVVVGNGSFSGNEFDDINPGSSSEANITFSDTHSEYFVNSLILGFDNTLYLQAGASYWINQLTMVSQADIIVQGSGTAIIYVNQSLSFPSPGLINSPSNNNSGDASKLVMYVFSDVTFNNQSTYTGSLYVEGDLSLISSSHAFGSISAANIDLGSQSTISYQSEEIADTDFGSLCTDVVIAPYQITGHPKSITGGDDWSWNGSYIVDWRAAMEDANNFGEGGVVSKVIESVDLSSLNASSLSTVDAFVSTWWSFSQSSSYHSMLRDFFLAGGDLILLQDDNGHDGIGEFLGIEAISGMSNPTTISSPLQDGPFGAVGSITLNDGASHLDSAQINALGGTICGADQSEQATFACWEEGEYALGAGKLVIITDTEFVTTISNEANYSSLNDKGKLALNVLEFLVRTPQTPTPLLEYHFDELSWTGSANEVIDSSGNNYNGTAVGGITTATGKICNAAQIPNNISASTFEAVDTGVDLDTVIGSSGTISLWYKGDSGWNSGTDKRLFDATDGDKYFFAEIGADGRVKFFFEDGNDGDYQKTTNDPLSVGAGVWKHLTFIWDVTNITAKIFVDGVEQSVSSGGNADGGTTAFSGYDTLYFGDSRDASYFTGESSADGLIDEALVFDSVLTTTQIQAIFTNQDAGNNWDGTTRSCPVITCGTLNAVGIKIGSGGGSSDSQINSTSEALAIYAAWLNASSPATGSIDTGSDTYNVTASGSSEVDRIDFGGQSNYFADTLPYPGADAGVSGDDLLVHTSGTLSLPAGDYTIFVQSDDGFSFIMDTLSGDTVSFSRFGKSDNEGGNELRFEGTTGNTRTGGSFNLAQDSVFNIAAIFFERTGVNYLEISIANTALVSKDPVDPADYEILKHGAIGGKVKFGQCVTNTQLDHYRIEHNTQGFTCEAKQLTIKACANEDCSTPYTEPVLITLSPSGWDVSDTITFENEQGEVTTTLSVTEESTVTLAKISANPNADLRCFTGATETCNINFVNAGFEFFGSTTAIKTLEDQEAETNFSNVNIRAVRDDEGVCKALLDGSKDITFTYNCEEPATCLTPLAGIPLNGVPSGDQSGTLSVTFAADGTAPLSMLNYADVGRLNLTVLDEINSVTLTSGSATVDVYPTHLKLDVSPVSLLDDSANYTAGEPFTFTIGAYGALGSLLNNYQAGALEMKVERVAPISSNASEGNFKYTPSNLMSSAVSSAFTSTATLTFNDGEYAYAGAYYDEVGNVELDIQDTDYLGNSVASQSAISLGTFIPAYFTVTQTQPSLEDSCPAGNFSYIGQTIDFATGSEPLLIFTGKNVQNAVTNNYDVVPWNFNLNGISLSDSSSYANTDSASEVSKGSTPDITTGVLEYDGIIEVKIPGTRFQYNKVRSDFTTFDIASPFAASINMEFSSAFLTDEDNVCYQIDNEGSCIPFTISNITGTNMRYGRLTLESTYGPETESLSVPIKAEFFNNDQWLLNTDDSNCTSIALTQAAGQVLLTGIDGYDTNLVGDVESDGVLISGLPVGEQLSIKAPDPSLLGPGTQVQIKLSLVPTAIGVEWPNHLNFDWDGDGYIDNNDFPKATVTFGQFRGNDRIIHWREVFN
jgi:MSHA biogenesis protein MshQ